VISTARTASDRHPRRFCERTMLHSRDASSLLFEVRD
jgi:hypothetical protein